MISTFLGYNESSPGGATNTLRGLTHSLDLTKEGLGMNPTRICTVDGCENPRPYRLYCYKHYQRFKKYGDPLTTRWATLHTPEDRLAARTTRQGDCIVWTGGTVGAGYGKMVVGDKIMKVHRYVWERDNGPIPDGMEIDHTCHNRKCVEPSHLRAVTRKQNMENLAGPTKASKTGVRGVHFHKASGKYAAVVSHNGRRYHLGVFPTIEEADRAAVAKRLELYTHNEVDKLRAQTILRSLDQKDTP